MQIKELEAGGGVKPQDSKIDTGMGAKRKVHKTNIKCLTVFCQEGALLAIAQALTHLQ